MKKNRFDKNSYNTQMTYFQYSKNTFRFAGKRQIQDKNGQKIQVCDLRKGHVNGQ